MANFYSTNNNNTLNNLFKPIFLTQEPSTNFLQYNSGLGIYQDLNLLFQPIGVSPTTILTTGFKENLSNKDLNQIFMDINYAGPIQITGGSGYTFSYINYSGNIYAVLTIVGTQNPSNSVFNNQTFPTPAPSNYATFTVTASTTINFLLIGGGAGGGAGATSGGGGYNNGGAGGGGAGGYIAGSFPITTATPYGNLTAGNSGQGGQFNGGLGGGIPSSGAYGGSSLLYLNSTLPLPNPLDLFSPPDIDIIGGNGSPYNSTSILAPYNGAYEANVSQGQIAPWITGALGGGGGILNSSGQITTTYIGTGGNGGCGCSTGGDQTITGISSSGGSASPNTSISILNNTYYIGGGGGGANNSGGGNVPPDPAGNPPGGSSGGGSGGYFSGGNNATTSNNYYGGGGGGATWGPTTGNGGNGSPGIAIMYWIFS